MRRQVRITVLKREFYPEYADEYLTEGRNVGPCPILKEGDAFVYEGGAVMPEGFCPWAWIDLYRSISATAGRAENSWYKPNVSIECCTDGIRPVIFRLEALEAPEQDG